MKKEKKSEKHSEYFLPLFVFLASQQSFNLRKKERMSLQKGGKMASRIQPSLLGKRIAIKMYKNLELQSPLTLSM